MPKWVGRLPCTLLITLLIVYYCGTDGGDHCGTDGGDHCGTDGIRVVL